MIRSYHKKDADLLVDIWLQASLQSHGFVGEDYWRGKAREIRNVWLPQAETYIWEENGTPIGFISVIDNEYVGALFVEPSWQGKGVGTQLLTFAQTGRKQLKLQVYVKNKRAKMFYIRHGFCEEQKKIDEDTGEEELLMIWQNPSNLFVADQEKSS